MRLMKSRFVRITLCWRKEVMEGWGGYWRSGVERVGENWGSLKFFLFTDAMNLSDSVASVYRFLLIRNLGDSGIITILNRNAIIACATPTIVMGTQFLALEFYQ
jgi:hypothetical protein